MRHCLQHPTVISLKRDVGRKPAQPKQTDGHTRLEFVIACALSSTDRSHTYSAVFTAQFSTSLTTISMHKRSAFLITITLLPLSGIKYPRQYLILLKLEIGGHW